DFLIRLSRDQSLLPPPIRTALAGTSLLFVGYSLTDWNFRVLFRGLVGSLGASLGYTSIAVQLPPNLSQMDMERARGYLNKYFDQLQQLRVSIYWGDVHEFTLELRQRWEKFRNAG
ncbi:MAG: SIR2 family protein, partial [Caldilinea sp.]